MPDTRSPNLADPDFVPTDEEELAVLRSVARRVAWEKSMGQRGIKVLALELTPEQENAAIAEWEKECSRVDDNAFAGS